jgi:hypothetical protein
MQYWLINYDATCPSGWTASSQNCYINSPGNTLPGGPLTAKDLATVQLSGSATPGGEDEVSLSVGSGQAILDTNSDFTLDLAAAWNTTEWGVFGDGNSGEAYFGSNTTMEAQTTITATNSSAPTCAQKGFTHETNNLKLASTPALGSEPSPTIASKQTNGTTGTASCAVAAGVGLNTGGFAQISSVSCASAGNCSAGGSYTDSSSHSQAFVDSQVNGAWGTAEEAPGLTTVNTGDGAAVNSVSCASAGNCSAGGYYTDSSRHEQAFVISQVNGAWGTATKAPGTGALNTSGYAQISSVSCAPAGNCGAGGFYADSSRQTQAFVDSQVNGIWSTAEEVPGTNG